MQTHADVDYCTDHNSSSIGNCSAALVIDRVIPKFADARCMRVMLASDDCSFVLGFAFVVGPDLVLA